MGKKNKNGPKSQQQQQSEAQQPPHSKPAPGSWASLVVSGSSAPNTPSRNTAQLESKNRTTRTKSRQVITAVVPTQKITPAVVEVVTAKRTQNHSNNNGQSAILTILWLSKILVTTLRNMILLICSNRMLFKLSQKLLVQI